MDNPNKHLFLIGDGIDEYTGSLDIESPRYSLHRTDFDRIPALLESLALAGAGDMTAYVIAVSESLAGEKLLKIKELFAGAQTAIQPLFVIFSKTGNTPCTGECEPDTFSYFLPDGDANKASFTGNLILYIEMLFRYQSHTQMVDDFIVNSFRLHVDSEMIRKQKQEIEELNHRLEELSKIDYLTNILNRRAFFEELEKERKRSLRFIWRAIKENENSDRACEALKEIRFEPSGTIYDHYGKFACLLMDIDHFKEINDTRGHLVGDAVLHKIGEILKSRDFFRETDSAGRYGGEEFIILLPETSVANAKIAAERLKESLKQEPFHDREGREFHLTVSMGLTEFKSSDKTNDQIIQRADLALYYAKNNGRDRIVVYEDVFPEKLPAIDS